MNSDQMVEGDLGIPVVVPPSPGNLVGVPMNVPTNPTTTGNNGQRPFCAQKSSEEESDHEYYNDIDRFQRELQPLRGNETTV